LAWIDNASVQFPLNIYATKRSYCAFCTLLWPFPPPQFLALPVVLGMSIPFLGVSALLLAYLSYASWLPRAANLTLSSDADRWWHSSITKCSQAFSQISLLLAFPGGSGASFPIQLSIDRQPAVRRAARLIAPGPACCRATFWRAGPTSLNGAATFGGWWPNNSRPRLFSCPRRCFFPGRSTKRITTAASNRRPRQAPGNTFGST